MTYFWYLERENKCPGKCDTPVLSRIKILNPDVSDPETDSRGRVTAQVTW